MHPAKAKKKIIGISLGKKIILSTSLKNMLLWKEYEKKAIK